MAGSRDEHQDERIERLEARVTEVEVRLAGQEARDERLAAEVVGLHDTTKIVREKSERAEVALAKIDATLHPLAKLPAAPLAELPSKVHALDVDLGALKGRIYGALAVITVVIPLITAVLIKLLGKG